MALQFTPEEAGAVLSALIAYEDRYSSLEEWETIYQYYDSDVGVSLTQKFKAAGLTIEDVIQLDMEQDIRPVLEDAGTEFQLRALAVGLKVAQADGNISKDELKTLEKYCHHLKILLKEVDAYARNKL